MKDIYVKFHNVDNVLNFVGILEKFENVEFLIGTEDVQVNPKSILGILSLDLSIPQKLYILSESLELLKQLKPYTVNYKISSI